MNAPHVSNEQGFTITEVIVAIIVLSVGLLSLASTGALTTRMIQRGERSAVAATIAARRMELLRPAACIPAQRVNGTETIYRGSVAIATNTWTFGTANNSAVNLVNTAIRIRLTSQYLIAKGKTRTETMETSVSCLA